MSPLSTCLETIDAPVFDANGQRLEGTNYLAELYALYIERAPTNLPPASG